MTSTKPSDTSPSAETPECGAKPDSKGSLKPPWKRGQSGNPAGRPVGFRLKLTDRFMHDLFDAWQERGEEVITHLLENNPEVFFNAIVRLMPRHVRLSDDRFRNVDPAQRVSALMGALRTLVEAGHLADVLGRIGPAGDGHPPGGGIGTVRPVIDLSPVSETAGVPRGGGEDQRKAPTRR